jgi:hypothetical protein
MFNVKKMSRYVDIGKLFNLGEKIYQKAQWDTFIHYRMFQKMYGGCKKIKILKRCDATLHYYT